MAMSKKEQAEMAELRTQLAIAKAFRFTSKVKKDVRPPTEWKTLSTGWTYNAYSKKVSVACSSSIHHSIGKTDETNTQNPIWMYSTKLKALRALRYELEQKFAAELADIDKSIEDEQKEEERPKGIESNE